MNSYSAYAENVEGIYGAGDILKEVKQSVQDSIDILMTLDEDEIPSVLKEEYELNFVFETQSFFEYYGDIFSRAALTRLTGIIPDRKRTSKSRIVIKKPRI